MAPPSENSARLAAVRELGGWPDVPRAADLLRRHKLLRAGQLAAGVAGLPDPVVRDWLADPGRLPPTPVGPPTDRVAGSAQLVLVSGGTKRNFLDKICPERGISLPARPTMPDNSNKRAARRERRGLSAR